jgi:hypothetical protein
MPQLLVYTLVGMLCSVVKRRVVTYRVLCMFSTSLSHFQTFQLFETDIRYIHFTMYRYTEVFINVKTFLGFLLNEGMLDSVFFVLRGLKIVDHLIFGSVSYI